jgi:hypothetical protein
VNVSQLEEPRVIYEEFKAEVWKASQHNSGPSLGLLPIPHLRRSLGERLSRQEFDDLVMRLHGDGLIHLMSHVEPESLPDDDIAECLCDETGLLLYWLRWL